jgi:hypothetical protein
MTAVRLVSYVTDPYSDQRHPLAVLLSDGIAVRILRADTRGIPSAARPNAERVLRDLEASADFDNLPFAAGAQVVVGEARLVPSTVDDPALWARRALLPSAA